MRLLSALMLVATVSACSAEQPTTARSPSAAPSATASDAKDQPQTGLEVIPLRIESRSGSHDFRVEVARTPNQQDTGMMFRRSVGADEGMLFPFPEPRWASFWMKNTLIPLDLIFIRQDGTIARIAANAVPKSLRPIGVGEPVVAVLELGGGRAAELGIVEGNRVSWPGGPAQS
jgi:uncharacterized protein